MKEVGFNMDCTELGNGVLSVQSPQNIAALAEEFCNHVAKKWPKLQIFLNVIRYDGIVEMNVVNKGAPGEAPKTNLPSLGSAYFSARI